MLCVTPKTGRVFLPAKDKPAMLQAFNGVLVMIKTPHPSLIDLTGQRFGKLTVVSRAEDCVTKSGKKLVAWLCKCDCGKKCVVRSTNLKNGITKSCGCIADKIRRTKRDTPNRNAEDFIGKVFGVLTVEKEIKPYRSPDGSKRRKFRCKCYCGKYKDVRIDELKSGVVVSCGCLSARDLERLKAIMYKESDND